MQLSRRNLKPLAFLVYLNTGTPNKCHQVLISGMRTEINKKRGRPSERSEEARAKGAKRGKNSWGVGGGAL